MARVPTRAWVLQFLVKGERSIFRDNLSLPGPSFGSVAKCKNVAAAAGASTVLQLPASGTCVTQKDEWGRSSFSPRRFWSDLARLESRAQWPAKANHCTHVRPHPPWDEGKRKRKRKRTAPPELNTSKGSCHHRLIRGRSKMPIRPGEQHRLAPATSWPHYTKQ